MLLGRLPRQPKNLPKVDLLHGLNYQHHILDKPGVGKIEMCTKRRSKEERCDMVIQPYDGNCEIYIEGATPADVEELVKTSDTPAGFRLAAVLIRCRVMDL